MLQEEKAFIREWSNWEIGVSHMGDSAILDTLLRRTEFLLYRDKKYINWYIKSYTKNIKKCSKWNIKKIIEKLH